MKRIASLLLVCAFSACTDPPAEIGDVTVCEPEALAQSTQVAFTPEVWQAADAAERGQMVVALAETHVFVGVSPASIRAVLGTNTCYVLNDDEPCYTVAYGGTEYALAFPVARSGPQQGNVMGAYLRANASAMSGCKSL